MRKYYSSFGEWSDWRAHKNFHKYGWSGGHRARRGDIGPVLLAALKEKPMHGYELIRKIEENSHGVWRPSPGSVYPTLQMLEEQELVTADEKGGKKVYSLTSQGEKEAEKAQTQKPWEQDGFNPERLGQLRELSFDLIGSVKRIVWQGSDKEFAQAKQILDEARAKLAAVAKDAKAKS